MGALRKSSRSLSHLLMSSCSFLWRRPCIVYVAAKRGFHRQTEDTLLRRYILACPYYSCYINNHCNYCTPACTGIIDTCPHSFAPVSHNCWTPIVVGPPVQQLWFQAIFNRPLYYFWTPKRNDVCNDCRWMFLHSTSNKQTNTQTNKQTNRQTNSVFTGTRKVNHSDFTGARDDGVAVTSAGPQIICIWLETDNHASTSPLSFYRLYALPAAQPTPAATHRALCLSSTRSPIILEEVQ